MSTMNRQSGLLVALAEQLLENVRKLESGLPASPTFEDDVISLLPEDLQETRGAIINQAEDLNTLVRGAGGPWGRILDSSLKHLDDLSLQAIYNFKVPQNVPLEKGSSIAFSDLARKCDVDEGRLIRFVRHVMTNHVFHEPQPGFVAHTEDSRLLATDQGLSDLVGSMLEQARPASVKVVDVMRECMAAGQPELLEAPDRTGFQAAFNTDKPYHSFLSADPELMRRFSNTQTYWERAGPKTTEQITTAYPWLDIVPLKDRGCESGSLGLVVDVGGGNGHYSVAIARKHHHLRLIVQDLPGASVAGAASVPDELKSRVVFQDHDAFTPQPVVADVYFLRHVFHNWPDAQCVQLLQNLVPALKPGARLLLCDIVIPDSSNAEKRLVRRCDMLMLSIYNARERTVVDIVKLFEKADKRFKFEGGVYNYPGAIDQIVEAIWKP